MLQLSHDHDGMDYKINDESLKKNEFLLPDQQMGFLAEAALLARFENPSQAGSSYHFGTLFCIFRCACAGRCCHHPSAVCDRD